MKMISIITVTYNCASQIEETLLSVFSQDYPNIEYIVIDGNSTDGTQEIIERYISKIDKFISEKDRGIYDAMNKGILNAKGDWIYFFNAGDVFYNTHIISSILQKNNIGVDVIWGDYVIRRTKELQKVICKTPFFENKKFYHGMGFSHQSVFVKTSLAKKYMFDLSFRCCADFNMMMTLYKNGARFEYLPLPIAIVEGRYGFSDSNKVIQMKDTARILGIENSIRFKFFYIWWRFKEIIKKIIGRNS